MLAFIVFALIVVAALVVTNRLTHGKLLNKFTDEVVRIETEFKAEIKKLGDEISKKADAPEAETKPAAPAPAPETPAK